MKAEKLILELESLCEQSGYNIRKERGTFRGDSCIIEGDKLIVVNKNRPLEAQVGILAKVLQDLDTEEIYIKPAVRKELQEIWGRMTDAAQNRTEETDQ